MTSLKTLFKSTPEAQNSRSGPARGTHGAQEPRNQTNTGSTPRHMPAQGHAVSPTKPVGAASHKSSPQPKSGPSSKPTSPKSGPKNTGR